MISNRLALGLGLWHKVQVEGVLKVPFATPAKHMQEYLDVLLPAMHDRAVSTKGDVWSAEIEAVTGAPGAQPPAVLLAAMGPRMLEMAGGRVDGSILWLSGPKTIEQRIKPALDAAAAAAGKPAPRIVASVPVCVTPNGDDVRGLINGFLDGYNDLPSYRGVMDSEGADGPADVSVVGTEAEVRAGIAAFAAAGATDFAPVEFTLGEGEAEATRALLRELAAAG
jgi:F420-dependent oxidoreductase-like protein